MRRIAGISLVFALLAGCGDNDGLRVYDNGDLDLVTAYTAKAACSCLFVANRTEAECRPFAKQNPDVASFEFDAAKKTVHASALAFWGADAEFVSDKDGCRLIKK